MRILIYGAGALGQAVGCILAADGHAVDLLLRERYIPSVARDGLAVTGIFGDFRTAPGKIGLSPTLDGFRDRDYDFALITTKSYDTASAVDDLAALPGQAFTAVSLQNGCGNLELLLDRFGPARTLAGRVITGFAIERPGTVRITVTADDIHIGGPVEGEHSGTAATLAAALDSAGLPAAATPAIRRDLYAKLLYNCALNPLGAILGVHYGALGESPWCRDIMNDVIGEVFGVIHVMGERTHWDTPGEYRTVFYENQIPATFNHRSSMLQDLDAGKRTEVDALTGYVSAAGVRLSVATPVCDTLTRMIRFREKGR